MRSNISAPTEARVMLTGTRINGDRFEETLRKALAGLAVTQILHKSYKEIEDQKLQSIFAAAKGVAEVAKRRQEGPVRCKWGPSCKNV